MNSSDGAQAFELGNRHAERRDLAAAEAAYREADEHGHPAAAAYAGMFDEARGRLADAEAAYGRADERGDGLGAFRLGLLLSYRGDWEGAREAWARADERGRGAPPFDLTKLGGRALAATAGARERSAF